MDNLNPRTYISVSRNEKAYTVTWKEALKGEIQKYLEGVNRSFSEEEYALAKWHSDKISVTVSGIDFMVYII